MRFFIFVVSILILSPTMLGVQTMERQDLMSNLTGNRAFLMTFEQSSYYTFLDTAKVSSGMFLFSPPRSFVWKVGGEQGGKIVSNGRKTWFYSPPEEKDDEAAVVIKDGACVGIASIIFDYTNGLSSIIKKGGLKELYIKGSKEKGYLWAILRFIDSPIFRIDGFEFIDPNGNRTVIKTRTFSRLSKAIPSEMFNFVIPKGTKIIQ